MPSTTAQPAARKPRKKAAAPTPHGTAEGQIELRELPLASLLPNVRNVRRHVGIVTELANSIQEVGLLEPLVVAPTGPAETGDDRWVLIAGHRRLAAVQQLDWPTVPCLVRPGLGTEHEQILAMLVENLQRSDLTPIEEATAYEQLTLAGFKVLDIAKRTGRSRTTVEQRLHLMELPEDTRTKVHLRQMTLTDAEALLEFADEPKTIAVLEKAIDQGQLRWELERARRSRELRQQRQAATADLQARGVQILGTAEANEVWRQRIDRWSLEPADHADCPGHAATVGNTAWISYFCLQPEQHGGVDPVQPAVAPDRVFVGRNEPDPDTEASDVAARLRRDFLLDLTTSTKPMPTADAAAVARYLLVLYQHIVVESGPVDWCSWLTRDDLAETSYADCEQMLAGWLGPDSDRDPHRILLALAASQAEPMLHGTRYWRPEWMTEDTGLLEWLDLLTDLGYERSPWEQEKATAALGAREAAAAEPA